MEVNKNIYNPNFKRLEFEGFNYPEFRVMEKEFNYGEIATIKK